MHHAGAALAVGKARGLGPTQLATAVALALYQPSHCLAAGFWEEGAKTLTASIPLEQGLRLWSHARRMNRSSGRGNRTTWRGAWPELRELARHLLDRRPVSDRDLDATTFRMCQSARVTVTDERGNSRTHAVEVPVGACGRDAEETRELVRWRCEQAFGVDGGAFWEALHADGTTVAGLLEAAGR
ncbi:MAG: hypothetical protein GY898_31800 [Proteobacteria bacterium]|nr:hypothetical protein [Pseudomonadota bacterium]